MFRKYLEAGYQPLPIGYLTKYPCEYKDGKWVNFSRLKKDGMQYATVEECEEWERWIPNGGGIGIALGEHSGVIALDFDADDEFTEKVKKLLPRPPVMKVGSKGVTAFYKYSGEKNKKWKSSPQDKAYSLEILSTGNQTVIPPSFHPTTMKPYEWVGDVSLLDVKRGDLPALPEGFYDKVDELLGLGQPAPLINYNSSFESEEVTVDDIETALQFIDASCPYEEWVEIGMALKDELGDNGFAVFDKWSQSSHKYPKNGEQNTFQKYKSFKNQGITIATLFKKARLCGYKKEYKTELKNLPVIPFIERLKMEAAEVGAKERIESGFPLHLCREAPGLVGDIQKWIEASAMFPQPILALCAAISVTGIIYGQNIKGSTDSRTNMYCLGVAPTGSGKDHPRKCVERLLRACEKKELIGGEPASSTGLLKTLQDGNGRRIIQIDELGRVLQGMTSKNAASHVAGLPTVMMKLFSSASSTYFGTEYANHDGKQERKDIDEPCLCIHAMTVSSNLYEAMSGSDVIDGFLSRWLIFEEPGYPDPRNGDFSSAEVPKSLIEKIEEYESKFKPEGNLAFMSKCAMLVPFSKEAKELADDFCVSMRKRAQRKHEEGDITYGIWTRTFEHATKLALVAHEGKEVSADVMRWALELATYCSQYLCDQAKTRISDNEQEKNVKYVLNIVKKSKNGITRSELVRKTQKLQKRELDSILDTLIEGEQVEARKETGTTRAFTKYF